MLSPVLSALIPAGISAAASIFGGERANRQNRQEAATNRQFQERMRNTAWQSGVEDMRAAGINPALAYSQGPATSPGGSMATVSDSVSPGVSSAMQAMMMRKQLRLIEQQISKADWETRKTKEEASVAGVQNQLATARYYELFEEDGTPKKAFRDLITSEVAQARGSSAFSIAQAQNMRFSTEQQKAIVEALQKMGAGGGLSAILAPFLTGRGR